MAKKLFNLPVVFAMSTGDSNVVGPGSGGSTTDMDEPWDYEIWEVIASDFPEIYDFDGTDDAGTWADYVAWWQSHTDWGEELFIAVNGKDYSGNTP